MAFKMNGPSLYKNSALKQKTEPVEKDITKEVNTLLDGVSAARGKGDMLTANILNTQAYKIRDDWNNRNNRKKKKD